MTTDKLATYLVLAIIAYFVLQAILPFMIWCVVGYIAIQAAIAYSRRK